MTPDEWVSYPDGQTVVQAMIEDMDQWTLDGPDYYASLLLAALRVWRMTPCPDCDGRGRKMQLPASGPVGLRKELLDCPRCAGAGKVPGVPLLVDALIEQRGWLEDAGDDPPEVFIACGDRDVDTAAAADGMERSYRVRVPAAQPEEPQ